MTVTNPDGPGAAVLHLHGDIDFFSEDEFRAEAEQLLNHADITRLIVDCGDVGVIDSSGLSLLVDLLRLCRDIDLPMTLRAVPERVLELLELTGLDQLIRVE